MLHGGSRRVYAGPQRWPRMSTNLDKYPPTLRLRINIRDAVACSVERGAGDQKQQLATSTIGREQAGVCATRISYKQREWEEGDGC